MNTGELFGFPGPEAAAVVTRERPGRPTTLYLRGEIDLALVNALRSQLNQALAAHSRVVVDMADTTFIDGTVLGVLAEANGRADRVRVRRASGLVAQVFYVVGLEDLLAPVTPE